MVLEHLTKELQMIELKNKIQTKVRSDIDKQQREYFLSQQLKTIQEENSTEIDPEPCAGINDRRRRRFVRAKRKPGYRRG